MIGTGIEALIQIVQGMDNRPVPKEYFIGFIGETRYLQQVLNHFNLTTEPNEIPVISVGLFSEVFNYYVVEKYLVPLQPGHTYAPLGDYATEKNLIKIDTIYPNEQTVEAAITAVNAVVFPHFVLANVNVLLEYLNTSPAPFNLSDESKIYYFQFSTPNVDYTFVLSEGAERGIYGAGRLQFVPGDLIRFFANGTENPQGAVIPFATANQVGGIMLGGDIIGPANAPKVIGKVSKGTDPDYWDLDTGANIQGMAYFDRDGKLQRSKAVMYDTVLKMLMVPGTQAIFEPSPGVTDGNQKIRVINNANLAFGFEDDFGDFFTLGTRINGDRYCAIHNTFELKKSGYGNVTQFIRFDVQPGVDALLKTFTVPNNSILVIDVNNIAAFNIDKKQLSGRGVQFTFVNNDGVVTAVYNAADDLRYKQYSTIKAPEGYVTNADARISASNAGTTVSLKYINPVGSKLTTLHCEVKYNVAELPMA